MKRGVVLGLIAGLWLMTVALAGMRAQQPPAQGGPNVAEIEQVKDNLYVITGGGGNTAAFVTANGVVLVDTKLANWGPAILDKVKTVTEKPITHIINTHTHGDHVGSNEFFAANVDIVTHDNTGANMMKMDAFKDPAKKHGLPDRTFKDRLTLLQGNESIDLYYFGPAHTNGDAFVVFRNLRVMHAGDAFSGPNSPIIDTNNGGTGIGYPDTLSKAAAGIKNVDAVIPGHSKVTTWQAFVDYGEFMRSFVTSIQTAAKAGKAPEQALSEFKPVDKFKDYNLTRAKSNVDVLYKEVQK